MAFPFTRDELVDWFMEFKQATYPFDPVTREQVDSIVEGIKDDGKVIFTSPGKINIIGEALLVKIGISVLAGLIAKAIIWGGGQVLEGLKLPPPEVADKLGVDADDPRRPIVINVVQFVCQNKADVIVQRYEALGLPGPASSTEKGPGAPSTRAAGD